MHRSIPNSLFRTLAPLAHWLRHRWRRFRKVPLHGVNMIARDPEGRVLLVRHTYGPEGWFLPGGGIGRGESGEQAAVRELVQETGCEALGVKAIGTLTETISGSPHDTYLFTCMTHDMPIADRREIAEARFYPLHSLPQPLGERTRSRLALWLETG